MKASLNVSGRSSRDKRAELDIGKSICPWYVRRIKNRQFAAAWDAYVLEHPQIVTDRALARCKRLCSNKVITAMPFRLLICPRHAQQLLVTMALCHDCDAKIEYIGNGSQTDYSFPFEYNKKSDVSVAFWNETA